MVATGGLGCWIKDYKQKKYKEKNNSLNGENFWGSESEELRLEALLGAEGPRVGRTPGAERRGG